MKKKKDPVKQEIDYVEFLRKRLQSANFKANVTAEEYEKTKAKYEKAKFKLKLLRGK